MGGSRKKLKQQHSKRRATGVHKPPKRIPGTHLCTCTEPHPFVLCLTLLGSVLLTALNVAAAAKPSDGKQKNTRAWHQGVEDSKQRRMGHNQAEDISEDISSGQDRLQQEAEDEEAMNTPVSQIARVSPAGKETGEMAGRGLKPGNVGAWQPRGKGAKVSLDLEAISMDGF